MCGLGSRVLSFRKGLGVRVWGQGLLFRAHGQELRIDISRIRVEISTLRFKDLRSRV